MIFSTSKQRDHNNNQKGLLLCFFRYSLHIFM